MNSNGQIDQFKPFLQETALCLELSKNLEKYLLEIKIKLEANKELVNCGDFGHIFDS